MYYTDREIWSVNTDTSVCTPKSTERRLQILPCVCVWFYLDYILPDFLFSFFAMRRCNLFPSSSESFIADASGARSGGSCPALVYLVVSSSSFLFFHSASDKYTFRGESQAEKTKTEPDGGGAMRCGAGQQGKTTRTLVCTYGSMCE